MKQNLVTRAYRFSDKWLITLRIHKTTINRQFRRLCVSTHCTSHCFSTHWHEFIHACIHPHECVVPNYISPSCPPNLSSYHLAGASSVSSNSWLGHLQHLPSIISSQYSDKISYHLAGAPSEPWEPSISYYLAGLLQYFSYFITWLDPFSTISIITWLGQLPYLPFLITWIRNGTFRTLQNLLSLITWLGPFSTIYLITWIISYPYILSPCQYLPFLIT